MSRDVTQSGGGGKLTGVPALSPELTRILGKRRVVPDYGTDEGVNHGGGDYRAGAWQAPDWVDQRDKTEAAQALPAFDLQLQPVGAEKARDFLLWLWNATKHTSGMSWQAVSDVYPLMLDGHPAWCFRIERLKLAAHNFQWFPSVQELVEFMEPDRQWIVERVEALRTVSRTATGKPRQAAASGSLRPWAQGGAEDHAAYLRERQDRQRQDDLAMLAARDAAPGLEPYPMEDPKEFVARLMAQARASIDEGARARRQDEARAKAARDAATQPAESVKQAQQAFRAAKEQGPPLPEAGKADKALSSLSSLPAQDPPDEGDRLANMTTDPTTEEEP